MSDHKQEIIAAPVRPSESGDADSHLSDFAICDLPFRLEHAVKLVGATRADIEERLLPVLFIRLAEGQFAIAGEALAWARKLVLQDGISAPRPKIAAVGRLYGFICRTAGHYSAELSPEEVDALIYAYLGARLSDTPGKGVSGGKARGVTLETAKAEFASIAEFSRFCASYSGPLSPIGTAFRGAGYFRMGVKSFGDGQSFFAHLRARQKMVEDLFDARPQFPRTLTLRTVRSSARVRRTTTSMSPDQVDAIIDGERNPIYRSLWILLAYAGPRLSEALNLWRCDILPGSYSRHFSEIDMTGFPLVIFAHPSRSPYVGDVSRMKRGETRRTHLDRVWGLQPRPLQKSRKRPGWKGMLYFHDQWLLSWAYWTSEPRAVEFARLGSEIRAIHRAGNLDLRHPYYFCNCRNPKVLYEPLSIGAAEHAFDLACIRVGIEPHSTIGAHIHGLRHFYEWTLKHRLKLEREARQIFLRHRSIESQEDYGHRAVDTYQSLQKYYFSEETRHDDAYSS